QPPGGQPSPNPVAADDGTDAGQGPATGVTANVIARVTPTFRFPGLADYAFVFHDPMLPSRSRDLLPYDQRHDRAEPTKIMQPLLLIPQLFSWLDFPQDYAFKQIQSKHHLRGVARLDPNWGDAPVISFYSEGVPPAVATTSTGVAAAAAAAAAASAGPAATAAAADGTTPATAQPADTAADNAGVADVRAYRVLETEVSRLLSQRPVWGLELMRERCAACAAVQTAMPGGCDGAAVERVVQRLCYRFKTGPWRGLFIRRGYDPRVDVEARKYQAIIYSLPNNWYRNLVKAGVRNSMQKPTAPPLGEGAPGAAADGAAASAASPTAAAAAAAAAGSPAGGGNSGATSPVAAAATGLSALAPSCQDDLHSFRALPTQQSTTFQLIDMQLKAVQEVLEEAPPSSCASRCSEKTGWFSNAVLQRMQGAIQQRFLQLMDELAPPGMSSTAAAAAATAGGNANGNEPGGAAGSGSGPHSGGSASASQKCPSAADGGTAGGDGDVEMMDADGTTAAAGVATASGRADGDGAGGAATAAAADVALRALMAQMNLRGLSSPDTGNGDLDVTGLFGSDDEDDEFQLLDEQEEPGGASRRGVSGRARGDGMATSAAAVMPEGRGNGGSAAAGGSGAIGGSRRPGSGAGAASPKGDEEALGDASDGEDSAMESEYDIGMAEEEEEEEESDEEDEGEGGEDDRGGDLGMRLGRLAGGMYSYDAYGRVTVPYDGSAPSRGGTEGMFGSEDDDEPY
ncbi:hypothetical protein VOLCADRAFT_89237, partial [Volvox carteri f. nagariensis]